MVAADRPHDSKRVKVFNVGYYVRLLDMNRSEKFAVNYDGKVDLKIPDGWYV